MADVSWVQPGFAALAETDGHGDSCGPIVMLDYRHLAHGVPLDIPTLDASRAELIGWGLMNTPGLPGMTMNAIGVALRDHYQVTPLKLVPWGQVNFQTFHTDLITSLIAHQAVIIETGNASALPGNQPGVQNHFILAWGIQSDLGYYCANGDTLLALAKGGIAGPVWYDLADLTACQPGAYAILPAVSPPPPPGIPLIVNGVHSTITHIEVTYG